MFKKRVNNHEIKRINYQYKHDETPVWNDNQQEHIFENYNENKSYKEE